MKEKNETNLCGGTLMTEARLQNSQGGERIYIYMSMCVCIVFYFVIL